MRSSFLVVLIISSAACEQQDPPPFDGVSADTETRDTRETRETAGEVSDGADGMGPCRELSGTVAISTRADLEQLEYARVVRGDLLLTPIEGLWSQEVRELTGSLRIEGTSGAPVQSHVAFTGISSIGGDLRFENTTKGLVDLYRLRTLGGSLKASAGGWALWTPALSTINGGIDIRDASHLVLTLDNLTAFGGPLRIERAQGLTALSLGRITKLRSAGEAVRIIGNPDLTALRLGAITTLEGDLRITNNPRLARATIDQALTGIIVTGTSTICGNLDDEACP